MGGRDSKEDRALNLLNQVKPEFLKILRDAPEFGSCGVDIVLHQGEMVRLVTRSETSRKLGTRSEGGTL